MFDFDREVLEASHQLPILVDFWAPWCGPCRVLGPVLDEIAQERAEDLRLIKINTEEETQVAQRYAIRSIPNVKLFHIGHEIAQFTGALSKFQIVQFLEEHLPTAVGIAWTKTLEDVKALDDYKQRIEVLEDFLKIHAPHEEAQLAMAKEVIFHNPDEAVRLVEHIKEGHPQFTFAQDIRTVGEVLAFSEDDPEPALVLQQAAAALRQQDFDRAARLFTKTVGLDKGIANELPRRAGIALFRLLGSQHVVTKAHRRYFDMALY